MASDWSELDENLLAEIAQRIRLYRDFLAFRCVCTAWRSSANIDNFRYKSTQIPWLMLAQRKNTNVRDFFDISRNKVTRQVSSPEAKVRKCYTSKGWLFTIARDLSISLLHPFSRKQIQLPGIMTGFKDWKQRRTYPMQVNFIWKCALSSNPSYTPDFTAMVIYGDSSKLAYYKAGDEAWTTIDTLCAYSDVIYHNKRFYAINYNAKLVIFDTNDPTSVKEIIQMPEARKFCTSKKFYVVESAFEGILLVVARIGVQLEPVNEEDEDEDDLDNVELSYGTTEFVVFEVNLSSKTWTRVSDLGNRALFLGHNSSFAVEVLDDDSQCKANCIYYTDDCVEAYMSYDRRGGGKDMGIYNIKDGSIIPHFSGNSYHRVTPPMWVEQAFD